MEWILTYVYDYEYAYNAANQMTAARLYDGKHYKDVEYTYDADGNRIMQEEVKPDGDRKVELTYDYSVENRLKAVSDKNDLLVAMAYDGDGNRIFQLNYNLHTDDDWKGNSGNGNGNNKDNSGSGNSGNGTGSKSLLDSLVGFFTGDDGEPEEETETTATASDDGISLLASNKDKDKGNDGNDKNNGVGNGNGNNKPGKPGNNGNGNGNNGNGNSENNGNTSTGGSNDNNGNANGNTNNTGGSQNQSGILFPIDGEVSELESELIGMIKTTGKEKNYELVEYVNDVNREHTEVLMELNINGIMDTAYSYGNERLTNERFTGWTGYYTYDPRGSVTGVTDDTGMIWQSYRYNVNGDMTFGKPQYNNVYSYNAESYNPNMESQYLRARYYNVPNGNFLTEDSYLGKITDPLTLNRYNYVKSSPLNYIDPSGHETVNEFYNHLPNYLTGESRDDDPFPYGAGQQAEWYKRHYPNGLQHGSSLIDDLIESLEGYLSEMMGWAKEYGNAFACDPLGNIMDIGIGIAYSFLENIVLRPAAGLKSYLTMGGFDAEAWLNSYEQAVINDKIKNSQSFYIGQLLGDAFQSVLLIMNFPTLVNSLAGALMAAASILSTGGIDMSVGANGVAMLVSAGVSERTAVILAESLGVAGSAVVAQLVLAMGGSIIDDVDKLAQSVSNGGGEGESKPDNPEDYLNEALERQGLDKTPKNMKESWTADGYKYEVRVHEANPEYGKEGSIYRVSRKKLGTNANGQGYGTEYLDTDGVWHHTSTLKPQNPSYNAEAAANTHIPVH